MIQYILSFLLILFSLGIILAKKPVYSALCFLGTLIILSAYYLELSSEFIATMQLLVYAGAILVVFMFVIILFQDAYQKIYKEPPLSSKPLLFLGGLSFISALGLLAYRLRGIEQVRGDQPEGFGTVEYLGKALYIDFFFPFEIVVMIFLIACVGALYIGRREEA